MYYQAILICLFVAVIQSSTCFLTYFTVFNDYGFKTNNLFYLTTRLSIMPNPSYVYNPYDEFNGNTNAFIFYNYELLGIHGAGIDIIINRIKQTIEHDTDDYL